MNEQPEPAAADVDPIDGVVAPVEEAGEAVSEPGVVGAMISDGAYTLILADFDDTDSAWAAYEALKRAQDGITVRIEGVVVVKRGVDGRVSVQKATDHSTKAGFRWGVIGGAVLGAVFPPSILAGAAVMGAIGAASGKARELHHRGQLADDLEKVILPGHDPAAVSRRFTVLTKGLGLPVIRLHDLRHTSASIGLEAGEPLTQVSRRLGHSTVAITGDIYTHVSSEAAQVAAENLVARMQRGPSL